MTGDQVTPDEDRQDPAPEVVTLTVDEINQVAIDAGHAVGRIHRRRIVIWTWAAAMLVSLAVAVPVGLVIHHNTQQSARNNARYDCRLVRKFAGEFGRFVNSDATLRARQAKLSITHKLLGDISKVIPVQDLEQSASASLALSTAYANKWKTKYLPALNRLAGVDCKAALP